jgi:hypothetical protein
MVESDQEWTTIRQELSDPSWDFRTIDGLSAATGLAPDRVASVLDKHACEVRKSNLPDEHGRILYTMAERSMKFQEFLANTVAFITKSVP